MGESHLSLSKQWKPEFYMETEMQIYGIVLKLKWIALTVLSEREIQHMDTI